MVSVLGAVLDLVLSRTLCPWTSTLWWVVVSPLASFSEVVFSRSAPGFLPAPILVFQKRLT